MTPGPPAVDTSTHCVFVPDDAGIHGRSSRSPTRTPPRSRSTRSRRSSRRCTADGGVEDALLKKLEQVASAPNANARAGKIGALRNQVGAQTGKAVDAGCAALVLALIDAPSGERRADPVDFRVAEVRVDRQREHFAARPRPPCIALAPRGRGPKSGSRYSGRS